MSLDQIIVQYLAADLASLGALPLPAPPRMPTFGVPRALHTPSAGMPAVGATHAPRRTS